MSCHTFFFNRKIVCSLSVSAFIASVLNSIMKSAVFFFPSLKVSIFYSASAAFVLSLNMVLISWTNSFQSWILVSLSSSLSFLCIYMSATPPLRHARITMILSSVSITLLLLRNSLISLHQSSNFVQSPSNHLGSSTMFFGIPACAFSLVAAAAGTGATDISVSICSYSLEASFVIYRDPSCSDNVSILFVLLELVLVSLHSFHYTCFVLDR